MEETHGHHHHHRHKPSHLNIARWGLAFLFGCVFMAFFVATRMHLKWQTRPIPKKIAFLFLTKDNHVHPEIITRFFTDAPEWLYIIRSHSKFRDRVSQKFLKDHFIKEHVETKWGDVSLVLATLALIRSALQDPLVFKLVLLSEKCVPIRSFASVYAELASDSRSWFIYQTHDTMRPEFLERHKPQSGIPIRHWVHHAQWMALNREHAELIVANDYTSHFRDIEITDEHYFLTLLSLLGIDLSKEVRDACVTFANWHESEGGLHPKEYHNLSSTDVEMLRASPCLFARKFAPDSDIDLHWPKIVDRG